MKYLLSQMKVNITYQEMIAVHIINSAGTLED